MVQNHSWSLIKNDKIQVGLSEMFFNIGLRAFLFILFLF